jgi:hypothetical protein
MVRFRTAFHDWSASAHVDSLRGVDGYSFPSGEAWPGELSVQVTDEWNLTREDDLSFVFTHDQPRGQPSGLAARDHRPPAGRGTCSTSAVVSNGAAALRESTGAAQLFAVDLNFALLSRRADFRPP